MPHVSRFPLKNEVKKEITKSLWWILAKFKTSQEIEKFLGDLLTPTEKTMVAKRLAIAAMLSKGYSGKEIGDVLKVSQTTVTHIKNWLEEGGEGYKMAVKKLSEKEVMDNFWKEVGEILVFLAGPGKLVRR